MLSVETVGLLICSLSAVHSDVRKTKKPDGNLSGTRTESDNDGSNLVKTKDQIVLKHGGKKSTVAKREGKFI
jgi:hypothetical protein